MSSPATSAHVPAGPGSSTGAVFHACSRHPSVDGPRLCRTCNHPLCTACARDLVHGSCPTCSEKFGLAAWRVGPGWLRWLVLDSVLTALPRLHRSALPLIALVLAVMQTQARARPGWFLSGMLGSAGEVALNALLLGSMATGLRNMPSAWGRVWRALAMMVVGGVLISVPSVLMSWGMASLLGQHQFMDDAAFLATLTMFLAFAPWAVLGSTLVVVQAGAALCNLGVVRSLLLPYSAGWRAWCLVTACCGLTLVAWWPLRALGTEDAGLASTLVAAVAGCVRIFIQAALAVGCLRFLLDARAARENA